MIEIWLLTFLIFLSVLALIGSIIIGLSAIAFFIVRVPYAPTPLARTKFIINKFNLSDKDIFYDLGCGDGRFIIQAAKTGATSIGFEIAPWAYLKAKINILAFRSKAKIKFENFYKKDISDATAVFCFLLDTVMAKAEKKLEQDLKPGTKVICYGFELPNWKPQEVIELKNQKTKKISKVFIYIKN